MGAAVEVAVGGIEVGRLAPVAALKTNEERHRDIIRNTEALAETALEDMTDETVALMKNLMKQVQADLDYIRRGSRKGASTGT